MECRRSLAVRILSVCLSVRLSVKHEDCDKTKSVHIYTIRKIFSLVFWEKNGCGGDAFYLKFWVNRRRWSKKIADFEQIIARSASAVTPSEKSSINTNRKYTTRFPMSLKWSSYVAPKSPKGGSKSQNGRFPSKLHFAWRTVLQERLLQSFFV